MITYLRSDDPLTGLTSHLAPKLGSWVLLQYGCKM